MTDTCTLCYLTAVDCVPSDQHPHELLCQSCKAYEDYYNSLTPDEQIAEHEAIARHCEQVTE